MSQLDSSRPATRGTRLAAGLALLFLLPLATVTGCPFKVDTFVVRCAEPEDCADDNECTDDVCEGGVCSNPLSAKGAPCGSGKKNVCDGEGTGTCVQCLDSNDCKTNFPSLPICDVAQQKCVSCTDGKKNGKETNVDCGGPDCGACQGLECHPQNGCGNINGMPAFCVMPENICCDSACDNRCQACALAKTGVANGTCAPIPYSQDPDMECMSLGGCGQTPGTCRCQDGVKNTDESDIDCGGATCQGCLGGQKCNVAEDCAATVPACVNGACCESSCGAECRGCDAVGQCVDLPAGSPHVKCQPNQACGASGAGCIGKAGAPCAVPTDCLSNVCTGVPSKTCQKGPAGRPCSDGADCLSGSCNNFTCG